MGGFSIGLPHAENKLLSWKTNKEKEVCAFLIHHEGTPADTALIIESIWPGCDVKKAKSYLYTCLSYLRRSLQEHDVPISVDKAGNGFTIRLDGAAADVTTFEGMLDDMLSEFPASSGINESIYLGYVAQVSGLRDKALTHDLITLQPF
jgi:Response regulator containing CheY-like receiver and SARP domains